MQRSQLELYGRLTCKGCHLDQGNGPYWPFSMDSGPIESFCPFLHCYCSLLFATGLAGHRLVSEAVWEGKKLLPMYL